MKTPEARVKDAVKQWLNRHSAYWYMVVPNGYSRAGVPDFIACLDGHFIGIETKAPGKRHNTTPNQKRELHWITRAGGRSLVVDDVAQLDAALGDITHAREEETSGADPAP